MKTSLSTMINGIKLWTRSLVQSIENKLQSDIDNAQTTAINAQTAAENAQATGEIQSDWAQNDDTAVDYVKNRPFYSEYQYTQFIGETTINTEPQYDCFLDELMEYSNNTIGVMWDGVMYQCEYNNNSDNGGYFFGDSYLVKYPFYFHAYWGNGYISGSYGSHTYSLHTPTEIAHKLDNKYYDLTGIVRYDTEQEIVGMSRDQVLSNIGVPKFLVATITCNKLNSFTSVDFSIDKTFSEIFQALFSDDTVVIARLIIKANSYRWYACNCNITLKPGSIIVFQAPKYDSSTYMIDTSEQFVLTYENVNGTDVIFLQQ